MSNNGTFFKLRIIILLILFCSNTKVAAQDNIVIIDYHSAIKVSKKAKIEDVRYLIEIRDEQSSWITKVEIPYSADEKITDLYANILDKNGTVVRKLRKGDFTVTNDITRNAFYEDDLLKKIDLNWNDYPYRIEYGYRRISKKFIHIKFWSPLVYYKLPVLKASLSLETPQNYEFKIHSSDSIQSKKTVNTKQGTISYRWDFSVVNPVHYEPYSRPMESRIPFVTIIPQQFSYGSNGSFSSWADFGSWVYSINEGLTSLTLSEIEKVDKLLDGIVDEKEKVRVLYHYLQDNTRYVNISIDEGGLIPYPAEYVCIKKYGDCKALTIYLKALLEHEGIKSNYVLINGANNPPSFYPDYPSQQFNHVILAVPLGSDTVWVENTANFLPFGYLGTFTHNRDGLFVDVNSSHLIRTPEVKYKYSRKSKMNISISDVMESKIEGNTTYWGNEFEQIRYSLVNNSNSEQNEFFEDLLNIPQIELKSWTIDDFQRDNDSISLKSTQVQKKSLRKIGDSYLLSPITISIPEVGNITERKSDLFVPFSEHIIDTLVYELNFLKELKSDLPDNISLDSNFGHFNRTNFIKENRLYIITDYFLKSGEYPVIEYPEFSKFMIEINNSCLNYRILIKTI